MKAWEYAFWVSALGASTLIAYKVYEYIRFNIENDMSPQEAVKQIKQDKLSSGQSQLYERINNCNCRK